MRYGVVTMTTPSVRGASRVNAYDGGRFTCAAEGLAERMAVGKDKGEMGLGGAGSGCARGGPAHAGASGRRELASSMRARQGSDRCARVSFLNTNAIVFIYDTVQFEREID